MKTIEYVLGFAFCNDRVLLIEKKRPAWQAGKLNGVGGHVEMGEGKYAAMVREFEEETGHALDPDRMAGAYVLVLADTGLRVHVFRFFLSDHDFALIPTGVNSPTDEKLFKIHTKVVRDMNIVDNLQWIIPLLEHVEPQGGPIHVWETMRGDNNT